jgi:Trk K+ transport system NAD-binding subunit
VGLAVTIVDTDAVIARRASEQFGLVVIVADATTAEVRDGTAIGRMDTVVSMLRRGPTTGRCRCSRVPLASSG